MYNIIYLFILHVIYNLQYIYIYIIYIYIYFYFVTTLTYNINYNYFVTYLINYSFLVQFSFTNDLAIRIQIILFQLLLYLFFHNFL